MSDEIVIIKIGGSILFPELQKIDSKYLGALKKTLEKHIKFGKRFVLVIGGGAISRWYMNYCKNELGIKNEDDIAKIGASCTRTNAEVMRSYFGTLAYPENYCDYSKDIDWKEPILVASAWIPGKSTNMDAVLLAKKFGIDTVIVNSNVDYIYSEDPKKNPNAKPHTRLSWNEYEKILSRATDSNRHIPGTHIPFDSVATIEAKKMGLKVLFCRGTDLGTVENILSGKAFAGTTIY